MALVTPRAAPSFDSSTAQFAPQVAGLVAGEDLLAAAPCYVKASDNKVYMSNGTAANEAARVHGFTGKACKAGRAVTLLGIGTRFGYADSGLTPGQPLYAGTTAGRLDTAATTGGTSPVAFAVDTTDIVFARYHLAP